MKKAFSISRGKGFHITFANGWTVSVQFGGGNYCDNHDADIGDEPYREAGERGSNTAECAIFNPSREMVIVPFQGGYEDIVTNRSDAAMVLKLLNWAAEQPAT